MPLSPPLRIIVMGPAGVGKTTLGKGLSIRLGTDFVDADDLHPARNIEMMRRGEALSDEERWPWLDRVAAEIFARATASKAVVIACSALRRSYRARLRAADAKLTMIFLEAPREVLEARVGARGGHFMPATLVASQCATLEIPTDNEGAIILDATQPLEVLIAQVVTALISQDKADG